ncbi:MAG: SMI1/KNR4 family protein [Ferruginibacter sp.]
MYILEERLNNISRKLQQLKASSKRMEIFGGIQHGFRSNKISPAAIERFEIKNNISIPGELRTFLLQIGSGAGPDLGIYNLDEMQEEYTAWQTCFSSPSLMNGEFDFNKDNAVDIIQHWNENPKAYYYKKLSTVNGLMPIQTEGCTYYHFIVMTGELRGKIWSLNTEEFDTLPARLDTELSFYDWYEKWLDESLAKIEVSFIQTAGNYPTAADKRKWWQKLFL